MSKAIKPTAAALKAVEQQYPDESEATKYRLAQAQTLIDQMHKRASKGGKARMKQLPAKQRSKLASKAAKTRWAKKQKNQ